MRVRAKMIVQSTTQFNGGGSEVKLGCVYSQTGENADFTNATPNGGANLSISPDRPAATAFKPGQEFYVDFIPVAEEQPAPGA